MYLYQEILQYNIVPILEPLELVSFSMTSRLFHDIVPKHISVTVIERINNMLVKFFRAGTDKIKEFMNDTGAFLAREDILQCILDESWTGQNEWWCINGIYIWCEIDDSEDKDTIYLAFSKIIENWGFRGAYSFDDYEYIFNNDDKRTIFLTFVYHNYDNDWLNILKSKYYIQNGIEKVEIRPSYNSIIHKTVKYDTPFDEPKIRFILKRLKDNGFRIDI